MYQGKDLAFAGFNTKGLMPMKYSMTLLNQAANSSKKYPFPTQDGNTLARSFLKRHPEGIVLNAALRRQIDMAIRERDSPITIEGETGTGKEQVVQYIHSRLNQNDNVPLIVLNCATLRKELAAATLFGHKKGAFTGAVENSVGAIGRAHRGLLFLDEFHRLESSVQEQILRTLQDGTYQRVGDSVELYSQFRLIVATPRSLEQHALEGQILMDLRFRLYGVEIRIPPLRERLDQLGDFIDCFWLRCQPDRPLPESLRESLIRRCAEFHWQGNVRQLFGVLRMLVMQSTAAQRPIHAGDLPIYPTMLPPDEPSHGKNGQGARAEGPATLPVSTGPALDTLLNLVRNYAQNPGSYETFLDAFEKELLTKLASQYPSVCQMCDAIGLGRSTLYAKKRRLGLTLKK